MAQRCVTVVLCITMVSLLLVGCGRSLTVIRGSGRVVTEERSVSGFDAISLRGVGELLIQQTGVEGLSIEAEDNVMPLIVSRVEGGTLIIGFDRDNWTASINLSQPVRFALTVRDLRSIDLPGATNVTMDGLETSRLTVTLGGVGRIRLNEVSAQELVATLSGAGDLELSGQVASAEVNLNGLGAYRAGDLRTSDTRIDVNGAAGSTIWVTDRLDVTIAGAGSVSYYGNPTVSRRITGLGRVNPLGAR